MAIKGSYIDFMFLGPPQPGHLIRYWFSMQEILRNPDSERVCYGC